jgi:hypothetical protein
MDEKIEYIRTFEHSQVDRAELKQMFDSVAIFVAMEQGATPEQVASQEFASADPEAYEKRYIEVMYNSLRKVEETGNSAIVSGWVQAFPPLKQPAD